MAVFMVETGAMALADGGMVGTYEFNKMRENSRMAVHKAMEYQAVPIGKAWIIVTLRSSCSNFAAAKSALGRWDLTKIEENIDLRPTFLSRCGPWLTTDTVERLKNHYRLRRNSSMEDLNTKASHTTDSTTNLNFHFDFKTKLRTGLNKVATAFN